MRAKWALVAALLVAAPSLAEDEFKVTIAPGVTPRLSASAVAGMVDSALQSSAAGRTLVSSDSVTVSAVECLDGAEYRSHFSHPDVRDGGPIWIVRMEGRFVSKRRQDTPWHEKGFYVVDDDSGAILAFGGSPARPGVAPDPERLKPGR